MLLDRDILEDELSAIRFIVEVGVRFIVEFSASALRGSDVEEGVAAMEVSEVANMPKLAVDCGREEL